MRIDVSCGDDVAAMVRSTVAESVVLVMAAAPAGFVEAVLRPIALAVAPRRVNAVVGASGDVDKGVAFLEAASFTTAQRLDLP
jgi:hypothetical protein